MPEGNSYVVKSAAPWGLPVLGVGAILSVLLLSPIGVFGIDWKVAAGIVAIGFVLLGSLVPPHFLILSTLLAFVGASMPIVNRGGAMTGFRWVVLIALGVGHGSPEHGAGQPFPLAFDSSRSWIFPVLCGHFKFLFAE